HDHHEAEAEHAEGPPAPGVVPGIQRADVERAEVVLGCRSFDAHRMSATFDRRRMIPRRAGFPSRISSPADPQPPRRGSGLQLGSGGTPTLLATIESIV